jgi:hypothetical protein
MTWVVDTCVVLDVYLGDPVHGKPSAELLQRLLPEGLAVCPVTTIELSPVFSGRLESQQEFLRLCGLRDDLEWTEADTRAAHQAWHRQIQQRRTHRAPKRPVADILIGAFALRHQGLVTRNTQDFLAAFPSLKMRSP